MPFKKGQSGCPAKVIQKGEIRNPAGKAPGTRNRHTLWLEYLDQPNSADPTVTNEYALVRKVIDKAIQTGNAFAVEKIMEQAYGKLSQTTNLGASTGEENDIGEITVTIKKAAPDAPKL